MGVAVSKRKSRNSGRAVRRHSAPDVTSLVREHLHPSAPTAVELRRMWWDVITSDDLEVLRPMIPKPTQFIHDTEAGSALDGVFDGEFAWNALMTIHDAFVEHVDRIAAQMGSAEWLFWLRRLRGQFVVVNNLRTTEPYVQRLAEALVTRRVRPSKTIEGLDEHNYYLSAEKLLALEMVHVIAAEIYELHSSLKRCAKGQAVRFTPYEMPRWVSDPVIDAAITRFDRRIEVDQGGGLASVGIADRGAGDVRLELPLGGKIPLIREVGVRKGRPFREGDPTPHLNSVIDLDQVQALHPGEPLDRTQVALAILLAACFLAQGEEGSVAGTRIRMTPVVQWGYALLLTEKTLSWNLARVIQAVTDDPGAALAASPKLGSAAEVLAVLSGIQSEVYSPLAGNPVHPVGEYSLIDLAGASHRLMTTLTRPRDGNVKAWGDRFEDDVQAVIDQSKWRPEGDARRLKYKKVKRRDGTDLTDIDAVAMRGNRLLLVSCKSFPLTREVARGDWRTIPGALDKVHTALADWEAVVAAVKSDPGLLGIPIAPGTKIDGCVVFPAVPYFTEPTGSRNVFGIIPVLLSLSELGRALNRR